MSPEDVAKAVELLPDSKVATLDVIAANCRGQPSESLALAYEAAVNLSKPQLLECLVNKGAKPPVTAQVRGRVGGAGGRRRRGGRGGRGN